MRLPATIKRTFRGALILYAIKVAAALIIVLPVWIFLNGKFGLSLIADGFWPIPNGLQLIELFWQVRELAVVIILLLLIAGLLYFLTAQFVYGGICAEALKGNGFAISSFCHDGGKYFGGFIKIALAAVPVFVVAFLVFDLIGLFIGKLIGVIAGETSAMIIMVLIIFLALYCLAGYLTILRFIQISINKSSLRLAVKYSKLIMKTQLRRFLALNLFAGLLTGFVLVIPLLIMNAIGKMEFGIIAALVMFIAQQLIVFLGSYFEAMQIFINTRIIKEYDYGT
jgi:hypothetical protein